MSAIPAGVYCSFSSPPPLTYLANLFSIMKGVQILPSATDLILKYYTGLM